MVTTKVKLVFAPSPEEKARLDDLYRKGNLGSGYDAPTKEQMDKADPVKKWANRRSKPSR